MNFKKLSFLLTFSGVLLIALSVVWFALAYAESMDFVGQYAGANMRTKLLACLYSSPVICQGAGFLSEGPSYSPVVFWIGMVALLGGVCVRFSLAKSIDTNVSNDSTTSDDKILGFISEQKYTRTLYILMLIGAVGGLFVPPLMIACLVSFILGLLGLFAFRPRLNDLDGYHVAAICVVFAVAFMLLLLSVGSFFFLLLGLAQIALFYIGFNSYRQGRTIGLSNLKNESQIALKSITQRFSGHEQN